MDFAVQKMSFLFQQREPLDITPEQKESKSVPSITENISAGYDFARSNEQSFSEGTLLKEEWGPLVEEINEATGSNFHNPGNYLHGGLFSAYASEGHGRKMYDYYSDQIFQHIEQNANLLPEEVTQINRDVLFERIQNKARANRELFEETQARDPSLSGMGARFFGQAGGIATDPVVYEGAIASLLASSAKTLSAQIFEGAMISAGTEAIAQSGVKKWYESLGYDYTWEQFYTSVATAGALGGALPLVFRVGEETVRLTADQARKGVEAFKNSGLYRPVGEQKAAEDVIESTEMVRETNPLANDIEHQDRLDKSVAAMVSNEPPPIPEKPSSEVTPSESVYDADNLRGVVTAFDPDELNVDAELFQFKAGGDEFGVTDRLQGITQWDPIKSGQIVAFEFADGRKFIADGHQRLGLARRIKSEDPSQDVRLLGHLLRETDGYTPAMARVIAATKNIAEGTGTALDAAKVLREAPERAGELPPRSQLVRQATAIVNLTDDVWGLIINDIVPANYAAIVGRLVQDDETLQKAAMNVLAKVKPANEFEAEAVVQQVRQAGAEEMTQVGLFGEEVLAESFYLERARVLDQTQKKLRQDKRSFQNLIDNANRLEDEGNVLARSANEKRAESDARAISLLQSLANAKGPISDALTEAARQARATGSYTGATQGFVDAVRAAIRDGDLDRLSAGDVGRAFNDPPQIREGQVERNPEVESFSEPGGTGSATQGNQLETDLLGDEVLPQQLDEAIPVGEEIVDGDVIARVQTFNEMREEFAQDQQMIDRLKDCVK